MSFFKNTLFVSILVLPSLALACSQQGDCEHSCMNSAAGGSHEGMDHSTAKQVPQNDFQRENDVVMVEMHKAMAGVKLTGNNDVDFMAMMIPHHQGAIDMAEIILKSSKDVEIRNLAQGIITEQKNEINIMQQLIKERAE